MIANPHQILSEEADDVLDSLRRLIVASIETLCGDTGRSRGEVFRALQELQRASLVETRGRLGTWSLVPSQPGALAPRGEEEADAGGDRDVPAAARAEGGHVGHDPDREGDPRVDDAQPGAAEPAAPERVEPEAAEGPGDEQALEEQGGAGPDPVATRRGASPKRDRVVEAILRHPEGISLRRLAAELGTPKHATRQLACQATQLGLVQRTGETSSSRYWPPGQAPVPVEPAATRRRVGATIDRLVALVAKHPGLTTQELADRLGVTPSRVGQIGRARLTQSAEQFGSQRRSRWYPRPEPDVAVAPPTAQPSAPAPVAESLEEPALAGGGAAQSETLAAARATDPEPSPRGGASSAPSRTGQPESGGAYPPPAAEPVRPPPAPAEGSPAAIPAGGESPEAAGPGDGSGGPGLPSTSVPVALVEPAPAGGGRAPGGTSPPPDLGSPGRHLAEDREGGDPRSRSTVEINASLFDRVLEQTEQLAEVRADRDGWETLAEERAVELAQVRTTLDRLQVPAGALLWRLGWLEGRIVRGSSS